MRSLSRQMQNQYAGTQRALIVLAVFRLLKSFVLKYLNVLAQYAALFISLGEETWPIQPTSNAQWGSVSSCSCDGSWTHLADQCSSILGWQDRPGIFSVEYCTCFGRWMGKGARRTHICPQTCLNLFAKTTQDMAMDDLAQPQYIYIYVYVSWLRILIRISTGSSHQCHPYYPYHNQYQHWYSHRYHHRYHHQYRRQYHRRRRHHHHQHHHQ